MTTADIPAVEPRTDDYDKLEKESPTAAGLWMRLETLLDRLGDRLNPILVKEARQAMKSRQFVVTFSLLLVFGWLWTVLFISFGVPAIFYAPVGPTVLLGYYIVLSVPLLIVVPYGSFRSLAAEREDGTYELLSITTLSARQIVVGKLGSAVLQMMVYYSALAPCIAFTYLLRGIDVVTIVLVLGYTFLASLLLSVFGLMMATITGARHWQVLLSVVFVMALMVFAIVWDFTLLRGTLETPLPIDQPDFWIANLCILSFYVPAIVLLVFIAGAQITFASENRSTSIRAVLATVPMIGLGWVTYYWMRFEDGNVLFALPILAGIYWAFAGAFLSGETAQLSPRAKRQLPQSFLGRMLFTWFNPGSGTGYVFTLLNLVAVLLTAVFAVSLSFALGYERLPEMPEWLYLSGGVLAYLAAYLGFVRLAVITLRRLTPVSLMAAFLCQVVVATCGIVLPLLMQALISWGDFTTFDYTILQLPNWAWTLLEISQTTAFGGGRLLAIIGSVAAVIFLLNLVVAAREVEHVRQQAPLRVLEDEAALHPQPQIRKRRNPWDEEAVAGSTSQR